MHQGLVVEQRFAELGVGLFKFNLLPNRNSFNDSLLHEVEEGRVVLLLNVNGAIAVDIKKRASYAEQVIVHCVEDDGTHDTDFDG